MINTKRKGKGWFREREGSPAKNESKGKLSLSMIWWMKGRGSVIHIWLGEVGKQNRVGF